MSTDRDHVACGCAAEVAACLLIGLMVLACVGVWSIVEHQADALLNRISQCHCAEEATDVNP